MNFWSKLSPIYTPPAVASRGDFLILREKILQFIYLTASVISIFALIPASVSAFMNARIELSILYIILYGLLITFTVSRNWSYMIRSHTAITLLLLFALAEMFDSRQPGQLETKLLLYIVIVSILFNWRYSLSAMAISIVADIALRVMNSSAQGETLQAFAASALPGISTFLLLSSLVVISITILINGLEQNTKKQTEVAQSLEHERDILEDRIQERTRNVARRLSQVNVAAEISRTMNLLNDPDTMLRTAIETIREKFDLYYVGVFLLDSTRQNANLQAGTGEAGRRMLADGHRLTVAESSMIGWCILNRKVRIALDVGTDAVRFSNPNLPLTRSELALPMMIENHVLGAVTIQSTKPNAFDEHDISLLKGLVDNLAVALQNDQLYHQTHQNLEEVRAMNREYLQRAWAEAIESYGNLAYTFDNAATASGEKPANTLQIPIMLRNEVIGQIEVETDKESLSTEEATFVENITNQTAIALENARLLQETERRAVQEQKLNELSARLSRALSIDEILKAAAQELGQLPAVAEVAVRLSPASSLQEQPLDSMHNDLYGGGNGKEPAA